MRRQGHREQWRCAKSPPLPIPRSAAYRQCPLPPSISCMTLYSYSRCCGSSAHAQRCLAVIMELMCRAERARDTWRGTTLTLAFARDAQVLDRLKSSALRRSEDESCEVLFKATTQEEGAATRACQMGGSIGRHAESRRTGAGTAIAHGRSPYVPMPPKKENELAKPFFGLDARVRRTAERWSSGRRDGMREKLMHRMCGERMTSPYGSRHYS